MYNKIPETLIDDIKFRHIRVTDKNNQFIKIRKKFRTLNELLDFYNNSNFYDCYYSVAKFLNPENIKSKKEEKLFETCFLSIDLFFDIDLNENSILRNIEKGKHEVIKLLEYAKDQNWKLNYIAFSGYKGFHLSFKDITDYSNCYYPYEREEKAHLIRKRICEEIIKNGIKIDTKVTVDTRRIVRVPFSYNSKTGYMCLPINEQMLDLDAKEFLKNVPYNHKYVRAESLLSKAMSSFNKLPLIRDAWSALDHALNLNSIKKEIDSLNEPKFVVTITSNAKKNHVVMLKIKKKYLNKLKEIKDLNIPFAILQVKNSYYLISPIIMQYNKLKKIARIIKSYSYSVLVKYKHVCLPVEMLNKNFQKINCEKILIYNNFNTFELLLKEHVLDYSFSKNHAIVFNNLIEEAENSNKILKNWFDENTLQKHFKCVENKLVIRIFSIDEEENLKKP